MDCYVNLVDVHVCWRLKTKPQRFETLEQLQKYTLKGKVFPKEKAYEGGLLRWLLREITGTYNGSGYRGVKNTGKKRTV